MPAAVPAVRTFRQVCVLGPELPRAGVGESEKQLPAGGGRGPRVPSRSTHPEKWGLRCVTQVLSAVSPSVPLGPSAGAAMGDTGAHLPCWGSHSRCLSDLVHAGAWRGRSRGATSREEEPAGRWSSVFVLSQEAVFPWFRGRGWGVCQGSRFPALCWGTAVGGRWN